MYLQISRWSIRTPQNGLGALFYLQAPLCPCLINNYDKSIISYSKKGLKMFNSICIMFETNIRYVQGFFNENLDGGGMDTDDPFTGLGGLGSGLGGSFAHGRTPFRSQSFNVGSNSGGRKDKQQDPPVEHDLYVSLDDICKVNSTYIRKKNVIKTPVH